MDTITSIKYVDGQVLVAGLSNEEFSSSLRSIPYPFKDYSKAAGIEIYHGSHGRFETNAPVRTFVPYEINHQQNILAAYTCTPLVKIPVSELKPGNKVKGTTIAELGNGNRPLDMIVYTKGGKHFILMANSSRGVMKLPADNLDTFKPITAHTEIAGVPYETIATLKGVQQLDKFDDASALILIGSGDFDGPPHDTPAVTRWIFALSHWSAPPKPFRWRAAHSASRAGSPARSPPPAGPPFSRCMPATATCRRCVGAYSVENGALVVPPANIRWRPGCTCAPFSGRRRPTFDIPKAAPPAADDARRARLSDHQRAARK